MKVLLNGLSLGYPISGVGQYTFHLGEALENFLGFENILWFGRRVEDVKAENRNHQGSLYKTKVRHYLKGGIRRIPGLRKLVHQWRNQQFRSYTRQSRPSLYHETNYTPFPFELGPTVVSVCDVSFVKHPEWHPTDRVKFFEKHCIRRIAQFDAVITISEFSKGEILKLGNVNADRIYVTPLGVDSQFSPGKGGMPGLPAEYLLFLGNIEPRKNLSVLLAAYGALPQKIRSRYPLVIAGARGWHMEKFEKNLRSFQIGKEVHLMGYVPQSLLPNLYRNASVFVYPSLYEGFGLPVLEAMASGIPVLSSNTTSLPEVVGDAGVLVNPEDSDELKNGIIEIVENEGLRKELSEKGLERAKLFSWEKCGLQTLAVYEKVLKERG